MRLYKKTKKLKDGTVTESASWWVRFELAGQQYRLSTNECDKKQAEKQARAIFVAAEAAAEEGKRFGPGKAKGSDVPDLAEGQPVTMLDLAAWDVAATEKRGCTPFRIRHIENRWVPVLSYFGADSAINVVTYDSVEDYIHARRNGQVQLTERGKRASRPTVRGQTIATEVAAIMRGMTIARRKGHITSLPDMPTVRRDVPDAKLAGQAIPIATIYKLFAAMDGRAYPAQVQGEIVLLTGLRAEEVRKLEWSWVQDHGEHKGEARYTLRVPPVAAKTKTARVLHLPARAAQLIRMLAEDVGMRDDVPLCPMAHRVAYVTASRRIGLSRRVSLRDLRHTYATEAAARGDLRAVQAALGHSTPIMTNRYLHSSDARTQEVGRHVSASIAEAVTPLPAEALRGKKAYQAFLDAKHAEQQQTALAVTPSPSPPAVTTELRRFTLPSSGPVEMLIKGLDELVRDIVDAPNGISRLIALHQELTGGTR